MDAQQLAGEIGNKSVRLREFEAELSAAASELTAQRGRHVKREISTGDVVQAQLAHDTIKSAIDTLRGEIETLRGQHQQATERERVAEVRRTIAQAAQQATDTIAEINRVRQKVLAAIAPDLVYLNQLKAQHVAAREQVVGLSGQELQLYLFRTPMDSGAGFRAGHDYLAGIAAEFGIDPAGVHVQFPTAKPSVFDHMNAPRPLENTPFTKALRELEIVATQHPIEVEHDAA
jgi:hypothetical protein